MGVLVFLFSVFALVEVGAAADHPDLISAVRGGQGAAVNGIASSPDGAKVALAGDDGAVSVFDNASGKQITRLGQGLTSVRAVAYSPNGEYLAAAVVTEGKGHEIHVWDAKGKLVHTLQGHSQPINDLAFSPDGNRLASVSNDNTLRIWNVRYGTLENTEKKGRNNLLAVAYSADGNRVATAENWDGGVALWDAVNVRLIRSFQGHADWVLDAAFSPKGKELATASRDGSVYLWDGETGNRLMVLRDPELDAVTGVAFSPDGRFLVGSTQSQRLLIWQRSDGKLVNFYEGHTMPLVGVAFTASGRNVVSAAVDGAVLFWGAPGYGGPDSLVAQAKKFETGVDPMDKDLAQAVRLLQEAADKGNAEGQYRLAMLYARGEGVEKNAEESRRLMALAAEQGHPGARSDRDAELNKGKMAQAQQAQAPATKAQLEAEAQKAAKEAAAQQKLAAKAVAQPAAAPAGKDKNALYEEGMRYFKGEGVTKDFAQAHKLFIEAAEMGHTKAQYRLGFMYSLGKGVKKSDQQAVDWWQKAAKKNDPDAQYYLGYMHEIGAGVSQDMGEAKKWYQKAAGNGSVNAVQSLRMMQ
ncbi:MAG: eIF2A-related protein [Thermodesulfobacteriota bacterium]